MSPKQVAELYGERWKIETFFKKVKQNLVIKTFIGTSHNAVMSQIWTAAITILLIEMIRRRSSYPWGYSRLAKYLQINLMTHKDLTECINRPDIPAHRYPRGFSLPQISVQMVLFE